MIGKSASPSRACYDKRPSTSPNLPLIPTGTDVGMALSHGADFDMCPRLKALKDRHLYLPRGCEVPEILKPICEANLDFRQVPMHWDKWVHLIASVYSGHSSAVSVL